MGLVGTWWSGQAKRVRPGLDGVLLVVVMGDGTLGVPVDCAMRRPDPTGPGGPCRDTLTWVQGLLDTCLETLRRRGLTLPPPVVVAESWLSDSPWMRPVRRHHQGTLLVEGKKSSVLAWADGRQVKGSDLVNRADGPWGDHPWEVLQGEVFLK